MSDESSRLGERVSPKREHVELGSPLFELSLKRKTSALSDEQSRSSEKVSPKQELAKSLGPSVTVSPKREPVA